MPAAEAPHEAVEYRGGNADLFSATEPELLLAGPSRTGKSMAACERLYTLCRDHAGTRALIVRKTRESLTQSGLVTLRSRIQPGVARWHGDNEWRFRNGSTITAVGMNEPTRIMSSEYDVIYVQEATELAEEDWEYLLTRLSGSTLPRRQLIGDCNPAGANHWLRQRAEAGKLRIMATRHEDNPALFARDDATFTMTDFGAEYLAKLDNLTGVRFLRLRKGLWVSAEGAVYEEFDWNVHLRDRGAVFGTGPDGRENTLPPAHWRRLWAIDFGYTHPAVWQAWCTDPETGTLYRYAELYHTKLLVSSPGNGAGLAERVLGWKARTHEPWPEAIICDHDAGDRATLQSVWGVPTVAATKDVKMGIEAVKQRLANQVRAGREGLVFLRDSAIARDRDLVDAKRATCTEDEMELYTWKDGVKDSEPVKSNDHGCDATRYLVAYVDSVKRQWSVEEIMAWGRDDIAAVTQLEGTIATMPDAAPIPAPNGGDAKSDDSWQDQWRADVAARQKAAYERMKTGR
jgi:Phage terminase large subunit